MTREERLAQNEARFREINEGAQPQRESRGEGRFICECADRSCMAWIEVPADIYKAVRADPRQFILTAGHETLDVETVVDRQDGYVVVAKPDEVAHIVGG